MRSPADDPYLDTLDNEDESPTLLLASRVGALQRLELLPTRRQGPDLLHEQLPGWMRQELAPPGRRFKLSWLQHNTELEHLAAKLVASGEVRSLTLVAVKQYNLLVYVWWLYYMMWQMMLWSTVMVVGTGLHTGQDFDAWQSSLDGCQMHRALRATGTGLCSWWTREAVTDWQHHDQSPMQANSKPGVEASLAVL